jgi:transposase
MVVVDGQGIPMGKHLAAASPHESKLIEATLAHSFAPHKVQRLIYDKAADNDALRQRLAERGIDLIAPQLRSRRRKVQDGRKLRRYRRRWKMERAFAWLGNFRRLVVRYERKLQIYSAFFHLACLMIVLRALLTWF